MTFKATRFAIIAAFAAACSTTSTADVAEQSAITESAPSPTASSAAEAETSEALPTVTPLGVSATDLCIRAELVEPTPSIDTELLPETSGISYSWTSPGQLYAHNDSGNLPRLYGINAESEIEFVWTIDAALLDWEDIALVGSHLYLADTGDNFHLRPTVRLLRVPEPDGSNVTLEPSEIWSFNYETQRHDAEALLVDVDQTEAVIITKGLDFASQVFTLDLTAEPSETQTLAPIAKLDLGLITAADMTADGLVIGLRTPDRILLFDRLSGATIAETLAGPFCEAPSAPERQGEAFAFHPDGLGYTTLSERDSATRNDFRMSP